MTRFRSLTALLLASALVFAACADDDDEAGTGDTSQTTAADDSAADTSEDTSSDSGTSGGDATDLDIADFEFMPMELTTGAGAEITVTNADGTAHTATANGGEFDSDSVAGGEEGALTAPDEAGEYDFYCKFHPFMKGTLVVE